MFENLDHFLSISVSFFFEGFFNTAKVQIKDIRIDIRFMKILFNKLL